MRVYTVTYDPSPNVFLFWTPYLTSVAACAYFSLTRHDYLPVVLIIFLALTLHSINVLSQNGNINVGKDSIHDLQIATRGLTQGRFLLGDPMLVSHAYDQSFYPGLEMFTSSLSLVTGISLTSIYNYSFVFINVLTLLSFFFLVKLVTKNFMIVNLSVLFYALCPQFNGFNSYTLHESLAIIFIPWVIAAALIDKKSAFQHKNALTVAAIISILAVAVTNEFAIYILTLFIGVITIAPFVTTAIKKKSLNLPSRRIVLFLTCLLSLFLWTTFVAPYFITYQGNLIKGLMSAFDPFRAETGPISQAPNISMPFIESALSYLGLGLLLLLSLAGIYLFHRKQKNQPAKQIDPFTLSSWAAICIGLLVLWYVIPWDVLGSTAIKFRILEYSYFGIAIFAAFAAYEIINLRQLSARLRNVSMKLACVLVVIIIAVPVVTLEFSPACYDGQTPLHMDYLNPVEAYATSKFVEKFVDRNITIAGTEDGQIYISGYAARVFWYQGLVWTLRDKAIIADLYYINLANVHMPDESYFTIGQNNSVWLNSQLNRVYDSGKTVVLEKTNYSQVS